ncbi:unnamed protein product [Pleuronectes platessa]|uniref:Uncharacterized protein n=1 Tax=Pleuronectes platessa TaxID=8262 RepID=A0A9N7Z3F5_PLEPL|nr:unnamed protein product [Pleuronectes platessa]
MPFTPYILLPSHVPPPTHEIWAMDDSSVASLTASPGTWRPARRGHVARLGAGLHALAAVSKVTRQALAWSQSVEPRPKIKRQPGRRGGNKGQMKREKS